MTTIPTTGPIALSQLADVFGPSGSRTEIKLSDFMRGSKNVSVRDALSGGVPAEAPGVDLKLAQYRGLGKVQAWPPAPMTANTTVITGQAYGNGTYVASASSIVSSDWDAWEAFNQSTNNDPHPGWHSSYAIYDATTGVYLGTITTIVDGKLVSGEWLQLQLPTPIVLSSYTIQGRGDAGGISALTHLRRMPQSFILAGSNDGTTWTIVDDRENVYYTGFSTSFNIMNNSNAYLYYRIIGRLMGNHDQLATDQRSFDLSEWTLYGTARSSGAASSLYSPRIWLRMDDLSSVEDGSEITVWPAAFDSGPTATAFKAGTASLPRVVRPPGGAMPYVQFGTNSESITDGNWLSFGDQTFALSTTGGFTAMIMVRVRTISQWERIFEFYSVFGDNTGLLRSNNTNGLGIIYGNGGSSFGHTILDGITTGAWQFIAIRVAPNNFSVFDGASKTVIANAPTTLTDRVFTVTHIARNYPNNWFTNMDLREFIVYDYALTDTQVESVRTYLMAKSGDVVAIDRTLNGLMTFDRDVLLDEEARYTVNASAQINYGVGVRGSRALSISGNTAGSFTATVASFVDYSGPTLSTANGFSMACWVYLTSNPATNNNRCFILTLNNPGTAHSSGDTTGFYLCFMSNVWYGGARPDGNNYRQLLSTNGQTNQWVHLALTLSGTTLSFYVNGVLAHTGVTTTSTWSMNNLRLGYSHIPNQREPMNGLIDDVRVYTRALSPSDIVALVGTGNLTRVPNGQRGLITFDANSTVDARGAFTGTATGTVSYVAGVRNTGRALSITGNTVGSLTTLATSYTNHTGPTLSTSNGFTMASWVNLASAPATSERSIIAALGNTTSGLAYTVYSNYYSDTVGFFDTATLLASGTTSNLSNLTNATGGNRADNDQLVFSCLFSGFFLAQTTGNYTFTITSDDAGHFWIGDNALSGYTTANANINNGGTHGAQTVTSSAIALTANTYYPILIMYGNFGGPNSFAFSFTPPSGTQTFNGSGWYFLDFNGLMLTYNNGARSSGVIGNRLIGTNSATATPVGWDVVFRTQSHSINHAFQAVPTTAVTNVWNHVAVTVSSTAMSLYVNGILANSDTGLQSSSVNLIGLRLACDLTNRQAFNGRIDDVQIYTRALSAHEVAQLCNPITFSSFGFEDNLLDARGMYTVSASPNVSYTSNVRTGASGKALSISGLSYVTYAGPRVTMTATQGFTMSCWVYCTTNNANDTYIINMKNPAYPSSTGFAITQKWDTNFRGYIYNGTWTELDANVGAVTLSNKWCHVAVTLFNGTFILYVNGISRSNVANAPTGWSVEELHIGHANGTALFTGLIDDLQIHTRALSAAEIAALANAKSTIITSIPYNEELRGHITFDGESPADERGGLIISSAANLTYSSDVPEGLTGKSLIFNASNSAALSYNLLPGITTWNNKLTITMWLKQITNHSTLTIFHINDSNIDVRYRALENDIGSYTVYYGSWLVAQYSTKRSNAFEWGHLTLVYEETKATMYWNGVPVSPSTYITSNFTVYNLTFTGRNVLKDIRVYSRALTPSEIAVLAGTTIALNAAVMSLPYTPDTGLRGCITGDNGVSSNSLGLAYPPTAMSANSVTISGQRYGNGAYVASASSEPFTVNYPVYMVFNNRATSSPVDIWASDFGMYVASTGVYQGTKSTSADSVTDKYTGEWVQLMLPSAITLNAYRITPRQDALWVNRSPSTFYIVASNDGTTWTTIDSRTDITWSKEPQTFFTGASAIALYSRYRMVVTNIGNNGITATRDELNIAEWELFAVPSSTARFVAEYPPAELGIWQNSTYLSSVPYGVGTYNLSASSTWDSNWQPGRAFLKTGTLAWMSNTFYDTTTGAYTGSAITGVNGTNVLGEWLQIQLPTAIQLNMYSMIATSLSTCPRSFILAGSSNGNDNTWVVLDTQTNLVWDLNTRVFRVTTPAAFAFYRIVIIANGNTGQTSLIRTRVSQWRIHGAPAPAPIEWPPASPVMTGNTSTINGQVYVASASSTSGVSYYEWYAFDKNVGTIWGSDINVGGYTPTTGVYTGSVTTTVSGTAQSGQWVQIQLPSRTFVHSYMHTAGRQSLGRQATSFVLAGSNDGITWYSVDQRTGQVWSSDGESKMYTCSSPGAYTYYRLVLRANGGGVHAMVEVGEIRLYGTSGDLLNPIDDRGIFTPIASQNVSLGMGPPSRKSASQSAIVLSGNTAGSTTAPVVSFMDFSSAPMSTANGFTWAMWVYPTELPVNTLRSWIATMRGDFNNDRNGITILYSNNGPGAPVVGWACAIQPGLDAYVPTLTNPAPNAINTWTHLAVTISGTAATFYVNGVQVHQQNFASAISMNVRDMRIGYNGLAPGTRNEAFNGRIDDILVYQRALSATEIAQVAGLNGNATAILDFDASELAVGTVTTWANRGSLGSAFNATGCGTETYATPPVCLTDTIGKYINFNQSYFTVGTAGSSGISWAWDAAGTQGLTFMVVGSMPASGNNYERFIDMSVNGGNAITFNRFSVTDRVELTSFTGGVLENGQQNTVSSLDNNIKVYVVSISATNLSLYVDAVVNGTKTLGTALATRTTVNNYIGKSVAAFNGTSGDRNLSGKIRQILVYNRPLSAAQVSTLTQQLRYKWGIGNEKLIANRITTNTPMLWIRSDEIAGMPVDTALSSWPSALGASATGNKAGTATFPLIKREGNKTFVRMGTGVSSAANGNWFDFGSQLFRMATNGGFTMICMVRFYGATLTGNQRIMEFASGAPNNNIILWVGGSVNLIGDIRGASVSHIDTSTNPSAVPTTWRFIALRIIPNEVAVWNDAVKRARSDVVFTINNRTLSGTFIGRSWWMEFGDPYSDLDMREFMVFDSGLSDGEIGDLRAYMTNKYG
jgi:hypothetical protein